MALAGVQHLRRHPSRGHAPRRGSGGCFRAPSGSITTLREDDYFHGHQLVSLGDTRHLDA
ncbi:hypothetical protein AB0383_11585 [Amycolatopsis sp. NPDC051373]|uniref:hypothetical protein n=1 Tax=Amycolatopsis sp. NPDC051373 TaxID=3155801 RepID=UPI00344C165D